MLVGLGILNGFDGRSSQALERGTGGVQQLVNYMSGLSGGSWFITSWALGDYEPLVALMKENWSLDVSMASTKRGTVKFAADIVANLPLKRLSTFEISSVDIWGRSISAMVLANANPSSIYGPGADTLYSSITSLPSFLNHQMPFPIVIALSREGDKIHVDHNSLVVRLQKLCIFNCCMFLLLTLHYLSFSRDSMNSLLTSLEHGIGQFSQHSYPLSI